MQTEIKDLEYLIGEQTAFIPTSWRNVTVGQFMKMRKLPEGANISHILEALTGVSRDLWGAEDIDMLDGVISVLEFTKELPDFKSFKMPEKYSIGGRLLEIPKDIRLKTLDQRITFEAFCLPPVNESADILDVLDTAIAVYIQPLYEDKPYSNVIEPTMEAVRGTLLCEAYPIANFFLRQYIAFLAAKEPSLKEQPTP